MKKTDLRTIKTKNSIKNTFLKLSQSKSMHKITVTEICKEIDINRGTFYLHYMDIQNVFEELRDDMVEQMITAISKIYIGNDWMHEVNRQIYDILVMNKEMCMVFFEGPSPSPYLERVLDYGREKSIFNWMQEGDLTRDEAEILFTYISNGCNGVMRLWYEEGFKWEADEFDQIISRVITTGLYGFLRN